MLGKPQSENTKGYTESGFQGHLTKVQIWSRALHVTNEIQKQVRDCRTEPVLYQGLILTWAGYDDTVGGVERVVPSHCGQRVCPPGYGGNKCQQLESDKIPPKVEYCPGDLWVIAKNGSAIVSWDEPKFVDNVGIARIQEKNGHRSGQTLMWGTYDISYVAYDQAGNSASCNFKVYVLCKCLCIRVRVLILQLNVNLRRQVRLFRFFQPTSAQSWRIQSEGRNSARTGALAVSSRSARSSATRD